MLSSRIAYVFTLGIIFGAVSAEADTALPPNSHVSPSNIKAPGEAGFAVISEGDSMEMVFVPGGQFPCGEDLVPVDLPGFYIDKYEVTNTQFAEFIAQTGYEARRWKMVPGKEDHPAVSVSLVDAHAYADWLGKTIPTDEQWEKAARGTDGRAYPWGNEWVDEHAVTPEAGHHESMPVGSAPGGASPYGAQDMVGNVWEWTSTWYDGHRMSLRGGAWDAHKGRRRSNCTYRSKYPPDRYDGKLGFRCVHVPEP